MNLKLWTILMVFASFVACTKTPNTSNLVSISVVSSNAEFAISYSIYGPNNTLVETTTLQSNKGKLLTEFNLKENFSATIQAQLTDEAVDRPEQIIEVEVLYNGVKADKQTFVINTATSANFYQYSIFN